MQACNVLLETERFNFLIWFLLCILTCGIYHVFYQYKMGREIVEIQKKYGFKPSHELPNLSLWVTVINMFVTGVPFVVDVVPQMELNKIARARRRNRSYRSADNESVRS